MYYWLLCDNPWKVQNGLKCHIDPFGTAQSICTGFTHHLSSVSNLHLILGNLLLLARLDVGLWPRAPGPWSWVPSACIHHCILKLFGKKIGTLCIHFSCSSSVRFRICVRVFFASKHVDTLPKPGAGHLLEQEAQLMLTTGSTRLVVSRGQQTWYHSTCYI